MTPNTIAIGLAILAFILPFLAFWPALDRARDLPGSRRRWAVSGLRVGFFLLAGVAPAALLPLIDPSADRYLWGLPQGAGAWAALAAATLLAFLAGFASPKDAKARRFYPLTGPGPWRPLDHGVNAAGWLLYLFGYECALRGYLPGLLTGAGLGYLPAAALMVAIYAAGHVHKGPREAYLCLPFGALLHGAVYLFGGVIPGLLVHTALAVGNDAALAREGARAAARETAT